MRTEAQLNPKTRASRAAARLLLIGVAHTFCVEHSATLAHAQTAAQEQESAECTSSDVLSRVELLREELELIRFEMGKPRNKRSAFPSTNAAPREVYFQALTLYEKVDRLTQDLTATDPTELQNPVVVELRPEQVKRAVDATLARLMLVKERLGISATCEARPAPKNTKPNDVYRAIVQANRQLNLMLDPEIAPSDVYQRVESAIYYANRLLEAVPGERLNLQPAPFVRGKRPEDVYRRLLNCFAKIESVAKYSKLEILCVQWSEDDVIGATPGDVYDLTSLIVSELAYLHSIAGKLPEPEPVHYPGRRFPSHVFQRVGDLEARLFALDRVAGGNPKWLKREGGEGE